MCRGILCDEKRKEEKKKIEKEKRKKRAYWDAPFLKFFSLSGLCCYSVLDEIVIFVMLWAWNQKKSEFPTELLMS